MTARKQPRSASTKKVPPRQPDYKDEVSKDQLDAIRRLADPDGLHAKRRVLLYAEAW